MIEAQRASGQTKKATVEQALRLLVRLQRQSEVSAAFGKYRWRGNLAHSRRGRTADRQTVFVIALTRQSILFARVLSKMRDTRPFAAPKGLRPRTRVKTAYDASDSRPIGIPTGLPWRVMTTSLIC
jgi:hypothetical protein